MTTQKINQLQISVIGNDDAKVYTTGSTHCPCAEYSELHQAPLERHVTQKKEQSGRTWTFFLQLCVWF